MWMYCSSRLAEVQGSVLYPTCFLMSKNPQQICSIVQALLGWDQGQRLQIWDCPGQSGTVATYEKFVNILLMIQWLIRSLQVFVTITCHVIVVEDNASLILLVISPAITMPSNLSYKYKNTTKFVFTFSWQMKILQSQAVLRT